MIRIYLAWMRAKQLAREYWPELLGLGVGIAIWILVETR